MSKNPDETDLKETAAFEISEAADGSAPDFLRPKSGPSSEPEWHLKDLERPVDADKNSLVEITLEDGLQPAPSSVMAVPEPATPAIIKPEPVDLAPDTPPAPPRPAPPGLPQSRHEPGAPPAITQLPARKKKTPKPPTVHAVEETAFEKDFRQRETPAAEDGVDKASFVGPTGQLISDGRALRFPEGTRFNAGDIVVCNEHRFRVKLQRRHPVLVYGKPAGLLALALLALIGISSFFSGPPTGSLTGVVVDAGTGKIIVGADVSLRGGPATRTNMAGMYTFAGLVPGSYEVRAAMPGYTAAAQTVARSGQQDASLSFALQPLFAVNPAVEQRPAEVTADKSEGQDKEKPAEYGALKLSIDFTDYMLYFDDKVVGKDVAKLTKIEPGDHQVMVEKEHYEDFRTPVTVKSRRTAEVTIALRDLKPKTTRQQKAKERFAEGKAALDGNQYQDAIKAFDAALAEQPEYPEARQYRGWAFRKLDNSREATSDFKAAAELYALSNRYLEAVTCVNLLVDLNPGNSEFLLMRGTYHTALGELKPALADFEAAANSDDKSLKCRLALAEGHYRAGQFKEAAREFEKGRKMATDPADIYVRLILSYMYAGKDKDLVKRYNEFAGIAPPEKMERLKHDPEWLRVLQLIGPDEKSKNP